ncbi:hypothetical protein ACN42_g685 [Penicillium freii]|uniref:Uncharacterized protein n=1 Tax=Penicillium freii TaxID=48697 RepID=A0A117NS17_PENFR|nr:hypothetical protein ACN42_g685 [Penicillium freii]
MWPIRCQYVPMPQIHRDQPAFSRYKTPRYVNECSWSPCAVNRRNRPAEGVQWGNCLLIDDGDLREIGSRDESRRLLIQLMPEAVDDVISPFSPGAVE